MTVEELLTAHGIKLGSTAPGQHYATCPQCSARRQRKNQNVKCLGVRIESDERVCWHCCHCEWSGPKSGTGKRDGFVATYDYYLDGKLQFQKVRYSPGHNRAFAFATSKTANGFGEPETPTRRSSIAVTKCAAPSSKADPSPSAKARKTLTVCGPSGSQQHATRMARTTRRKSRSRNGRQYTASNYAVPTSSSSTTTTWQVTSTPTLSAACRSASPSACDGSISSRICKNIRQVFAIA